MAVLDLMHILLSSQGMVRFYGQFGEGTMKPVFGGMGLYDEYTDHVLVGCKACQVYFIMTIWTSCHLRVPFRHTLRGSDTYQLLCNGMHLVSSLVSLRGSDAYQLLCNDMHLIPSWFTLIIGRLVGWFRGSITIFANGPFEVLF